MATKVRFGMVNLGDCKQLNVTISGPHRIIATPGRLVHVAVEMNLKLQSVEYVVFDEADRSVCLEVMMGAGGPWLPHPMSHVLSLQAL